MYGFHWGEIDNNINFELRPIFTKFEFTKSIFKLNQVRDNAIVYIDPSNTVLYVEVDYEKGSTPNPNLEAWISQMIQDSLGKKANITIDHQNTITAGNSYTDKELRSLTKTSADHKVKPYLHIVYLNESSDYPTNIGRVVNQDTIFMFTKVLNNLTDDEDIQNRLEQSTLMHEYGHLLGFDHIDIEDCVMSEKVEVYGNSRYQGSNIPTTYCPNTLFDINKLRSN